MNGKPRTRRVAWGVSTTQKLWETRKEQQRNWVRDWRTVLKVEDGLKSWF